MGCYYVKEQNYGSDTTFEIRDADCEIVFAIVPCPWDYRVQARVDAETICDSLNNDYKGVCEAIIARLREGGLEEEQVPDIDRILVEMLGVKHSWE
jgi:hypothetical protein